MLKKIVNMSYKFKLLFIAFTYLIIGSSCYSQNNIIVKLAPFDLLNLGKPTLNLSVEYLNKKIGVEYEHGFNVLENVHQKYNRKLFKSQLSLRYYFFESIETNHFFGLSYSYLKHAYYKNNYFYNTDEISFSRVYYDKAKINYTHNRFLINYGFKHKTNSPFIVELIIGLGFKQRIISHHDVILSNTDVRRNRSFFSPPKIKSKDIHQGVSNLFSLNFSAKVGYVFGKNR